MKVARSVFRRLNNGKIMLSELYLIPLSTLVLSEAQNEFLKEREKRIVLDIEGKGLPLWSRRRCHA